MSHTSMTVLSNCQSFVGIGSVVTGTPGFGLKVPGTVHLGYSSNRRAHSFRLTSKTSMVSNKTIRVT